MTTTTVPTPSTQLRHTKQQSENVLVDFNQDALRNALICASGRKLSQVASSSTTAMKEQLQTIRQSISDFDSILDGMKQVEANVGRINSNVGTVVEAARESSQELNQVTERMDVLQKNFAAINNLVCDVNQIADQTQLLALNATVEAARGLVRQVRASALLPGEVKELANTTKLTNRRISEAAERIAAAVTTLSTSVENSVQKTRQSIAAVEITRENAAEIGRETRRFGQQLQASREHYQQLDASSITVQNEIREINAIGRTFTYLIDLMSRFASGADGINPLHRLLPLVESSTFRASHRFTLNEPEYVLKPDDILISATDTKGVITFANNCFCQIAEYQLSDLIGLPHNVIRHPDMPRTAFADLWKVIQSGSLWQGYVANRSRRGRLYWVKASVFPCYENNQIVGYISVRTKPEPEMVELARNAYRCVP